MRLGLRNILGGAGFASIYECTKLSRALELLRENAGIGLVVLDLWLEDSNGIDTVTAVKSIRPNIRIVVFTGHQSTVLAKAAFELGVEGFMPKSASPEVMLSAVQLVLAGGTYLPPELLLTPVSEFSEPALSEERSERVGVGSKSLLDQRRLIDTFAPREREVAELLLRGMTNKEIARALDISVGTVKNYVAAILGKLQVSSRLKAVSNFSRSPD